MISAEEARQIAEAYAEKHRFEIARFHSMQHFPADEGEPSNWIVRFEFVIPDNVVSGPELLLVSVDDYSGEAWSIESL